MSFKDGDSRESGKWRKVLRPERIKQLYHHLRTTQISRDGMWESHSWESKPNRAYLRPKPTVSESDYFSGAVYTNLQTSKVDINRIRKEKKEKVLSTKMEYEFQMLEKKKDMALATGE